MSSETPRAGAVIRAHEEDGPSLGAENTDLIILCAELERELSAALARVAELEADARRYRWLAEHAIQWKPPGYDGCSFGRFDMDLKSDSADLGATVDVALAKEGS